MKCLALLGASGHGKAVAEIAVLLGYKEIVFFDDQWPQKKDIRQWPIVGKMADILKQKDRFSGCIVSIGDNSTRLAAHNKLLTYDFPVVSLIHPRAIVSKYISIGAGSVIMPGSIIQIDTSISDACIINTGATIDHDCILQSGSHISPGANLAGSVSVGLCSWVGVGAAIKQGVSIADYTTVGAGAVVINDTSPNTTVVGCPAKTISKI